MTTDSPCVQTNHIHSHFGGAVYSVSSHYQITSTLLTLQSPIHSRRYFAQSKFSWKLPGQQHSLHCSYSQPHGTCSLHTATLHPTRYCSSPFGTRSDHLFSVPQRTKAWDEHLECFQILRGLEKSLHHFLTL